MLHIYTRTNTIWHKEFLKDFLATALKRRRGPSAVTESVTRGLSDLSIPFKINSPYSSIQNKDTVYIVSGVQALKDILSLKERREVSFKLLAGPTISVLPTEENSLLLNPLIDAVIVPSDWVRNLYISIDSMLESRIHSLPAGVDPEVLENKLEGESAQSAQIDTLLIYLKNVPEELHKSIIETLQSKNIKYKTLIYGKFKREEYFKALQESFGMIYLSPTESQGIALHEAWIRNIPTLVWSRGYWEYKGIKWNDLKISAPYLSDESGLFFKDEQDFESKILEFISKISSFKSREYSLNQFTDAICAKKLMCIIESIKV